MAEDWSAYLAAQGARPSKSKSPGVKDKERASPAAVTNALRRRSWAATPSSTVADEEHDNIRYEVSRPGGWDKSPFSNEYSSKVTPESKSMSRSASNKAADGAGVRGRAVAFFPDLECAEAGPPPPPQPAAVPGELESLKSSSLFPDMESEWSGGRWDDAQLFHGTTRNEESTNTSPLSDVYEENEDWFKAARRSQVKKPMESIRRYSCDSYNADEIEAARLRIKEAALHVVEAQQKATLQMQQKPPVPQKPQPQLSPSSVLRFSASASKDAVAPDKKKPSKIKKWFSSFSHGSNSVVSRA
eukprot:TRINITY_DN3464_c0_g1_i1.p1 TRINITY_DN3464_c0_g1~~TRINITY_DN3464_c0_g1_i1.p1  ORF type:complete len:301 (-),score=42.75 TRINITY_DN3464_c0_g1_i1:454-1356(-)